MFFFKKKNRLEKTPAPPEKQSTLSNYDNLSAVIQNQTGRSNCFLLAGASLNDLPVTVPVNLAVRLARNHSCLLIDLDLRRNAIAQVFDIPTEAENYKTGSHPTPIENLSIWPARNFELLRHMNLRLLVDSAIKKYDYVLLYAPYLTTLPDRRQIAACASRAFAFTGSNGTTLMHLLNQSKCKVMLEL